MTGSASYSAYLLPDIQEVRCCCLTTANEGYYILLN